MPYNTLIDKGTGMKIQLKPITITYTRTLTFIPTEEMFEDWDIVPSQEKFEDYIGTGRLVDAIYEDVVETGILPYTAIQQGETVEIEYEPFEIVEFDSSIFDEDTP